MSGEAAIRRSKLSGKACRLKRQSASHGDAWQAVVGKLLRVLPRGSRGSWILEFSNESLRNYPLYPDKLELASFM